jgi:signal transduction histidine kinase/CheY-like chemotaxis protein/PAS domain-containing protein
MKEGRYLMPEDKNLKDNMAVDALDLIPSGIGIFDVTDSVITMRYLNDGFYRMIGAKREERVQFQGTGAVEPVHPDDRAGLYAEVADSIREKRIFDYCFRNLTGDGKYQWIGIRASHMAVGERTERFFASYYNVDRYVSEAERLETYGNSLDAILGNIPGGAAVFSSENGEIRLEYTNDGFFDVHHGSRKYWLSQSKNPVEWLTKEDQHIFWEAFEPVSSGKEKQGEVTYRIIGEDGGLYWVANYFRHAYNKGNTQYYYASFTDMDKQLAAEEEILRDKQMYDAAAKSAKIFIWSYDISTHRVVLMQGGYTEETRKKLGLPHIIENMPDSLLPYVNPEDRKTFSDAYHSVDAGAETVECEFRYQTPVHDKQQYEKMILKRITDSNGRLLNVYCFGQNITEQKQEEEKFYHAYDMIKNPNSYGSFHLNLTTNWCGNGLAGKSRMKAVKDLEKSGTVDGYFKAFSAFIADNDIRSDFFHRFERKLLLSQFEQGTEQISIEYPVLHSNGERHWREGFLDMVKNPKTGDVEAVTYSLDIDARKRDEFIMRDLIHNHFDYIGIIHPIDRTFEFCSRRPWITYGEIGQIMSYEDCCEFVRSQFEKSEEIRTFNENISIKNILRELNEHGNRTVTYLNTAGGKPACIRLQYSWLENKGGDILVVRSDITDFYMKEQNQIQLLEKEKIGAEAASIAKSEFLSRMSHDIRTPLNGIIGMTYLAEQENNPPKTSDCLAKISTSSKFLLGLINDVLDMSRVESNNIELRLEPYPIEELKSYLDAVIRPLCVEKGQTFVFDEQFAVHDAYPLADKLRCNQIIFNLLSNAVKYTPEGGTITYSIKGSKTPDGRMQIEHIITDSGIGMSAEFQKVLFEPFTQENRNDNSELRGTGLGLSIVKRLVDRMGGTVEVQSTPGIGTSFHVTLCFDTIPASAAVPSQENAETSQDNDFSLEGKHILLCEDHPLNQEIAKALLAEKKIVVSVAEDGRAGVETFRKSAPNYYDAILMDIRMPVLDGFEATKQIREIDRPDAGIIPIIAMTADAFEDDVQKCLENGMNGHIAKPIDPQIMYDVLEKCIKK